MVHNSSSEAMGRSPWGARTFAAVNAFADASSSAADNGRVPGSCEAGYRQGPLVQEHQDAFAPPLAACTAAADTDAFAAAELDDRRNPEVRGVPPAGNHLRSPWKGGNRNLRSNPHHHHRLASTSREPVLSEVASPSPVVG